MRIIESSTIREEVRKLFKRANTLLPEDAEELIKEAAEREEKGSVARNVMGTICENLDAARDLDVPICQDTGMAVIFAEIGCDVHINGNFEKAVNEGVRDAYLNEKFRCSVVSEPLFNRKNTNDNTPAVIHISIVDGDKVKLTAAPKGFGSENMSALKMFTPSATKEDIINFVVSAVKNAGSNPCPPIMIGVGIGGTFEKCAWLAKKALTRSVSERNADPEYARLESEILERVNATGIGPQGFGGKTTALCVNVEYYPTHIAGLPVAVNINCHVMRHAECEI